MAKNYTRETFRTREEWLRGRGFGGSSASAIIGKNPYMSKLELYKACVNPGEEKKEKTSDSMTYGTLAEPLIRKMFSMDYGERYKVHTPRSHEMYRRKDKKFLTATVDGILTETETGRKGILEIKTHDFRNGADEENWYGRIPDNYFIQVLHYMMVMDDMQFAVLYAKIRYFKYDDQGSRTLDHSELRAYEPIERAVVLDQIKWLEEKETEFWERYVSKRQVPPDYIDFGVLGDDGQIQ